MITREIMEAQLELYQKGHTQAVIALEKAKANVSAFGGGVEAIAGLLGILKELEEAQSKSRESSVSDNANKQETMK